MSAFLIMLAFVFSFLVVVLTCTMKERPFGWFVSMASAIVFALTLSPFMGTLPAHYKNMVDTGWIHSAAERVATK
jgi:hypothetical protein